MMVPKLSGVASKVNDAELEQLLFDLLRIPSVNPNVKTDDEPAETQIVEFLDKEMMTTVLRLKGKWLKVEGGILLPELGEMDRKRLCLTVT